MTRLAALLHRAESAVMTALLGPEPTFVRRSYSAATPDPSSRATRPSPVTARRGSLSPAPVARPSLAELIAPYLRSEA